MAFCTRENVEKYKDYFEAGIYVCSECEHPLFSSKKKYEHASAWPAFTETVRPDSVVKVPEENRPKAIQVSCGKCKASLGHEFLDDGPEDGQSRF